MRTFFKILVIAVVCAICGEALVAEAAGKKRNAKGRDGDSRKADYVFLEAKRQGLQDNLDSYFELMRYAGELNPDDKYFGAELGLYYLQIDSAGPDRGLTMLENYVEANPDDLYKNYLFATLCTRMGNVERALKTWRSLHNNFPERQPLTYRYAEALQAYGDSASRATAIAIYDSLAVAGADPMDIAGRKSSIYYQMNDTASIVKTARALLDSAPENPDYNIYAGQIYQTFLKSDSALVFFDRALELAPANGMAYYAKANYYNELNDSVGYDRETFNALKQNDLSLDVKLALLHDYVSKLYADTLQQPRIGQLFSVLEEMHPHEPGLHDLYSDYLVAINDYNGAAYQTNLSLELEPADPKKWLRLASLYLQTKEYDRSADAAKRGEHYFPDNVLLYELEANALLLAEHYEQALPVIDRALSVADSTDIESMSTILTLRGDTYYKLKDTEKAFEAYARALEIDPDNRGTLNNVAYYLACEGRDLDRAMQYINRALEGEPDNTSALDTYAWVLFKRKEYAEAKNAIDRVLELSAGTDSDPAEISAEVYEHAGDIYFMNGDPESAVDFWNDALKLDPDNELLKRKVTHETYFYK